MRFGIQSEVGTIKSVLIMHPKDAFNSQDAIDSQWQTLNYTGRPDFRLALDEYEQFVSRLQNAGAEVYYLPPCDNTSLDSLYVRDTIIMTPKGAVLCQMGKEARQSEPNAAAEYLTQLEIPVIGAIAGEGRLEGGDIIWLNSRTLVVGQGYRTNMEGIRQLRQLTSGFIKELIIVPLPHWEGPDDVFHLMSIISPIDYNLAVVYSRLMPVPFRQKLLELEIRLVEVPDEEFVTMGCNILALAPRKCLMLSGNPRTRQKLEAAGVEVLGYTGAEISLKGAGGPTCLTRPLLRQD